MTDDSAHERATEMIRAAGGAVFSHDPAGRLVTLLICDKYGVWTLPKGHLEDGETEEQAAVREIHEETGVQAQLGNLIRRVEYPVYKKGAWRDKCVSYFIAWAGYQKPQPAPEEGIMEVRWMEPAAALPLLGYAQVREVLRRAVDLIARDKK